MPTANEHGSLVSGDFATGHIDKGDIDTFTFDAAVGEGILLRAVDINETTFYPQILLYAPDGQYIKYAQNPTVAYTSYTATQAGTYTVVVLDVSSGFTSTGDYQLQFAHMPSANELGYISNGSSKTSSIGLGDIDSYKIVAGSNQQIALSFNDLSQSSLYLQVLLYGPDGNYITYAQSGTSGTLYHTTLVTGSYTAVVLDVSSGFTSTGNYKLSYDIILN